ncbi:MAG: hydrolase [Solirubrobacteraceae bacterium]
MSSTPSFWICETCGVEHAEAIDVCAICDDERQWVPADGQRWTTLEELARSGRRTKLSEFEPDLYGITIEPQVGIGQQAHLVTTPQGSLLWDPTGYVDDDIVSRVRELGEVLAITSSHPHMFGVQVEWSRALGGVPVLISEADAEWIARPDAAIETWSNRREVAPGVTLHQLGGHFTGSAVVHWAGGAGGKGVLLASDTIHTNPDRESVTFMRSYPNRIPLSPGVAKRLAEAVSALSFDRLYDNFGRTIDSDARSVVRRSADRYIRWTRGEFDDLT